MAQPPAVSVVVATRDRAPLLERLLAALRAQTLPGFEVVVVDDGSVDSTPQVLARAADAMALKVVRVESSVGPAAARDAGLAAALAPLIAFTDDDCEPAPDWLAEGVAAWDGTAEMFVQGRTDPADPEAVGPFTRTLRVHELGPYFQTCNVFYPRALLERVGGFDPSLRAGEDFDLAWRCQEAGARPVLASEAQVRHAVHQLGPKRKLRIAWAYSGGAVATVARHPGRRPLAFGVFWHHSHFHVLRALAGLVVPRRGAWRALRFWCFAPLVPVYLGRARAEGGGPWIAPYFLLYDTVEVVSVIRAAIKHRVLVL